jgi:hypothetical protein
MDIRGEAKLQRLPMQPNNSQATKRIFSGEGLWPGTLGPVGLEGRDWFVKNGMVGLTILGGVLIRALTLRTLERITPQ